MPPCSLSHKFCPHHHIFFTTLFCSRGQHWDFSLQTFIFDNPAFNFQLLNFWMRLQTNQLLNSVHHFSPSGNWSCERTLMAEFRRLRFKFQLGHWLALWASQNTQSLYCLVLSPANRQNNTNPKSVGGARTLPGGRQPGHPATCHSGTLVYPPSTLRKEGASYSPSLQAFSDSAMSPSITLGSRKRSETASGTSSWTLLLPFHTTALATSETGETLGNLRVF